MRVLSISKFAVLVISFLVLAGCDTAPEEDLSNNSNKPDSTGSINQKPNAIISPSTNKLINLGDSINFSGDSSYDSDGNQPLSYSWTFSGVATSLRTSDKANPGLVTFTESGIVTVNLVVTDSLGLSSRVDRIFVTVNTSSPSPTINRPPEGTIGYSVGGVSGAGNFTISAGTNVEFNASATDADNDVVNVFNWSFPFGATLLDSPGRGPFTVNFSTAGTYLISLTATDVTGNTDPTPAQVTVTVVNVQVNLPPNGFISHDRGNGSTGSVGNFSITTGDSVVFVGTADDPENDSMTYAWNFPAGVTAQSNPSSATFTANFPTVGAYDISFTVTDSNGNVDPTPAQVRVTVADAPINLPPNGSISHDRGNGTTGSVGNFSITTGDSVVFVGTADDPENDSMTYAWNFPAGVTAQSNPSSATFTANFPTVGAYDISFTVTDSNGNVDPTPAQVRVTVADAPVNLPPNGSISHDRGNGTTGSVGNFSITTGDSVVFVGTADDPENDSMTYAWNFPAGVTAQSNPSSATFTANFPAVGAYDISFTVTDSNGNVDPTPAQVRVTVADAPVNLPPNGSISHDRGNGTTGSVGNFSITTGDSVVFVGTADDPENDSMTYAWNFPAGVTAQSNPSSATFTANFPTVGAYDISFTVTDSNGNVDPTPAQVRVTVADAPVNLPPNGSISHDRGNGTTGSVGNFSITTGDSVVFVGTADDPENDSMTYAWNFPAGVTAQSNPSSATFTANFPTVGAYDISFTVTDSNGNVDPSPAQVRVTVVDATVNQPPDGSITHDNGNGATGSVGNISVNTGDIVIFSGSAIDPENNPVTYDWISPTGVTVLTAPGGTTFTALFPTAGTYLISLIVTDSNNNVDPSPAQVTVTVTDLIVNLAPNGSITHDNGDGSTGSIGDANITAGVPIVFNGSADDPENDAVTYAWSFVGATASATTGSGPISVMYTTPGTFLVSLTVSDVNGNVDPLPAELLVNVSLPEFQYLPVLNDEDGNPNNGTATYTLNVEDNVNVNVTTPNGNWVTPMMRYNGRQLPPVVVAKRGTQIRFNVNNNLVEETTVHWHGFKIPAIQDGGPDFPIAAGTSRTYNYTLAQPAGPLWFHPHAHGFTATQVYNGLAGAFIVTDDVTDSLENNKQIPAGINDIAVMLQDRRFAADNGTGVRNLIYQAGGGMMGSAPGMLGDHVLVNGVELPGLEVETRQYRFRLFNGSNARTYDIALADGAVFRVVGTDGGLLNNPVQTDHIMLGAGERAEIVIDFGAYAVGENVMLISRAFNAGGMMNGGSLPNGAAFNIMRFDVTAQVTDDVVLYSSLPSTADINARLTAADATASRSFVMSMGMGMTFLINGKTFDMNRVDEVVARGATEIWDISNTSGMAHPFHAHAIQWQILDRNGVPATGVDLGWKDTVLVQPNESVRFIGRFDPVINVGKYMYHCHILEHEDVGMMGVFEVQ